MEAKGQFNSNQLPQDIVWQCDNIIKKNNSLKMLSFFLVLWD